MFTTRNSKWKNKLIPALLGVTLAYGLTPSAKAVGTWAPLNTPAPESGGIFLLLTDGRIMVQGTANRTWYALTPDAAGSYANGTWSPLASMATKRLYYVSQVLRNGDVLIAGGEYSNTGSGDVIANYTNLCEIYHTQTNSWATVPIPTHVDGTPWASVGDAVAQTLADGRVLMGDIERPDQALYDYTTNTWTPSTNGKLGGRSDEESWALLPDGSVLTIDCDNPSLNGPNLAERYIPSTDSWLSAGQTPLGHNLVEQSSAEIGPGMLLTNGSVLFSGATGHTALYSTVTGAWVGGPDLFGFDKTTLLAQKDAPGCVEVNGKVLLLAAPDSGNVADSYPSGQHFLEYTFDSTASHGSLLEAPTPPVGRYSPNQPAYPGRMLQLPNGQVLFANIDDPQVFVYTPDSGPNPAWKPVVSGVSVNMDGSYLIAGTQFNGLTQGANYGDDAQVASNYPLVRLTTGSGVVSYARTFNHSTMGVATGSQPVSTNFALPPPGSYQLQVVANGIASDPLTLTVPLRLASLAFLSPVLGGTVATATVTLNGPAPVDTVVGLSSSNSAVVRVHRAVIIPAGSSSATFPISTYRNHVTKTVTITATLASVVQTLPLTITGS